MRKVKTRVPLFVGIAICLTIVFFTVFALDQRALLQKHYAERILERERNIEFYLDLSQTLYIIGRLDDVNERLRRAREKHEIDFYVLKYKGEILFFGNASNDRTQLDLPFTPVDTPYIDENLTYQTIALDDESLLTVGIRKEPELAELRYLKDNWLDNTQYLINFVLITLGITAFFFREILEMLRSLKAGRVKNALAEVHTRTLEGELMRQGLTGYEAAVAEAEEKSEKLGQQVLPSLKSEILSGRKPPYDFQCTLVRTDINNFTTVFHSPLVDLFMADINAFFTEVTHIVSRYGGLIHEFVGDEVIYYFKDDDTPDSFAVALGAVRDINAAASRFNDRTQKERGYSFTVKSSLAHGTVRFGRLVNGHSLAGGVLIETVRILSHVVEKDGNVVVYDSLHSERASRAGTGFTSIEVQLKGMPGTRTLVRYRDHRPLDEVLNEALLSGDARRLSFYRSDEDLAAIIRFFSAHTAETTTKAVFSALRILRNCLLTSSDGRPRDELIGWMRQLAGASGSNDPSAVDRVLSAVTKLAINLIPRDAFTEEVEATLRELTSHQNRRVVANALDVLTHFQAVNERLMAAKLIDHEDSRIAANAIIHLGTAGLDKALVKRMREMIESARPGDVASGLYSIGELARFHRERDLIYFKTQTRFLKLVDGLPRFVRSRNDLIRRQALVALRKCGDETLIAKALEWASQQQDPNLLAEVEAGLGRPSQFASHRNLAA